jgi:isopentenyl phosphate kinase
MKNLTLVKLGGSLITDKRKASTAKPAVIRRLARECLDFSSKNPGELVLSHGSGSFGHKAAAKYSSQEGFIRRDSKHGYVVVEDVASQINRIVVGECVATGLNAVSFQPSAGITARNRRIVSWDLTVFKNFLAEGFVPAPFGDVVLDGAQGCSIASADEILFYLARELPAKRIIMVGNVDGVFSSFPATRGVKPVPVINSRNFAGLKEAMRGAAGTDVTGGMLHKAERMLEAASFGTRVQIINGEVPGRLRDALAGKKVVGTTIA